MTVKMTQNDSENKPLRMTLLRLLKHCDLIMKNEKENLMGGYNLAIVVSLFGLTTMTNVVVVVFTFWQPLLAFAFCSLHLYLYFCSLYLYLYF